MTTVRRRGFFENIWRYRILYLMLLPALLYFLIFRYGSMLGLLIAFQDYKPVLGQGFYQTIFQGEWVGFKHFAFFFTSPNGLQVLRNTILISIYKIVFGFLAPVLLALLLNEVKRERFKKVIQTISYLPHFMSWVILAGILRVILSPDYGVLIPLFQKLQLMATSGEQPADVMQLGYLNTVVLQAGWLKPLTEEFIQQNMPRYYDQVNEIYDKMWAWGKDPTDGTLYGIPSFNMYGPTRHTLAYRGDWLEKFGMEPPTTIEEFEVWLEKCRTEDPNGNGQADEYGYTSQDMGGYFSEVFGAYGVMPGQWMIRDDKVVNGAIQPEVKDALALLKKWYGNDWIPKGIMTTAKRDNDFYAGIVGTMGQAGGYAPAIVPSGSYTASLQAQNPDGYIVGAPSFKGPEGHYGTWEYGPKKYMLTFGSHVDDEKAAYIMKMFETIATEKDLFELTMLGERGVHWDYADPEAESGSTVFLEPYTDFTKKLNEVGVREMSESAWCPIWIDDIYNDYLDPLAIEYAHQNEGYFDPLLGISTESSPLYSENLNNYVKQFYLEVITGKTSMDEFDNFVAKWLQDGGEILTQEANDLYDLMFR